MTARDYANANGIGKGLDRGSRGGIFRVLLNSGVAGGLELFD